MYAQTRYQPRQSRAASIGASLLISGAIITGMIYSAPNVIRGVTKTFQIVEYHDDIPPPPIEPPKQQPKVQPKLSTQPPITAPTPMVKSESEILLKTSPDIPPVQPDITKPIETGPVIKAEPRVEPAVAPFVGARRDARYAEDFQPGYPASELRAQRDGRVSVKVLVGADGRVKAVEQLSATSAAFFDATRRQALSKWRFKPATRGGEAVESWMTLSVTFEIKDQ